MTRTLAQRIGGAAADVVRKPHGIDFLPGLNDFEVDRVESWLGACLAPDHREFLQLVLPHGPGWPDWRYLDPRSSYDWMADAPVQGVLFDVQYNGYWHKAWGMRPDVVADALTCAGEHLATAARLVPVYMHRYLPAGPSLAGHPVLSIHQTDVIYYGADLADYLGLEFGQGHSRERLLAAEATAPFWKDLC